MLLCFCLMGIHCNPYSRQRIPFFLSKGVKYILCHCSYMVENTEAGGNQTLRERQPDSLGPHIYIEKKTSQGRWPTSQGVHLLGNKADKDSAQSQCGASSVNRVCFVNSNTEPNTRRCQVSVDQQDRDNFHISHSQMVPSFVSSGQNLSAKPL